MATKKAVKVWDIAVRVFHWTLVVLFFVSYLSGEEENLLHIYAGYGVLGLVLFRIVWGFIGTKHARFSDFLYGPKATMRYLRSLLMARPTHYLGHNPLGGWMAILLLLFLLVVCWSGLEWYGAQGQGLLAMQRDFIVAAAIADEDENEKEEDEESQEEEFWEEIHEALADFTLFLVFVHIAGAVLSSLIHRENLIKAMITGYKTISSSANDDVP